jgi:hypothetical protein
VSSTSSKEKSRSQRKIKRPKPPGLKSDTEDGTASADDTNLAKQGDEEGDVYDSDDVRELHLIAPRSVTD